MDLHEQLRRMDIKGTVIASLIVGVACVALLTTTWVSVRVIYLTEGLKHSNDKIAAQQVVLHQQQGQIKATATDDARANCASLNVVHVTARQLVREEAAVQIGQALKLYQRSQQTVAVNPPKGVPAQRARAISDVFLRQLVADSVSLSVRAIQNVDARTKPINCSTRA